MNTSHNSEYQRIVVLDTETTGMNQEGGPHYEGHRIIEIGAVEIINRKLTGRHFHVYLKPDRMIQEEAINVHGITDEFLRDKPDYVQVHQEFIEFIKDAELVAHNAPFDVGFMDYEFSKLAGNTLTTAQICKVTDTLAMAKRIFPVSVTTLTCSVIATASITLTGPCTGHCLMRRFWLTFIC